MTTRALALVAMLAVRAVAEPPVDCDRLPPWDGQHTGDYRHGDRVWARAQLAVEPHAYECSWHLCPTKYGLDTPEAFRRWKDLGACSKS